MYVFWNNKRDDLSKFITYWQESAATMNCSKLLRLFHSSYHQWTVLFSPVQNVQSQIPPPPLTVPKRSRLWDLLCRTSQRTCPQSSVTRETYLGCLEILCRCWISCYTKTQRKKQLSWIYMYRCTVCTSLDVNSDNTSSLEWLFILFLRFIFSLFSFQRLFKENVIMFY